MYKCSQNIIYLLISILITTFLLFYFKWTIETPIEIDPIQINNLLLNYDKYNKLFKLNLKYIHKTECNINEELLAIIIVTSYFGNVETRSAMRRTYSQDVLNHFKVRRFFLLGINEKDKYTHQNEVNDEANRFGDIVQGNFQEAYRNLTYKHMMGLKFATRYCSKAKYIIKMDDDIVINLPKIVNLLNRTKFPEKLLAGYILKGMRPIREKANKWFVTEEEYPENKYPTFLSGWFYITNQETVKKLLPYSHLHEYLWIDDLYITGILAADLKVHHYSLKKYFTVHPEFLRCCMHDVINYKFDCEFLVGPNGGDNNLYYDFNEVMRKCDEGCTLRTKSINDTCVAERKINLGHGTSIVKSIQL